MNIVINSLNAEKIDNLICPDMDLRAKTVEHKEEDSVFVDVTVVAVKAVVVCEETITFIFNNGNMFVAEISNNDYYKIEVL